MPIFSPSIRRRLRRGSVEVFANLRDSVVHDLENGEGSRLSSARKATYRAFRDAYYEEFGSWLPEIPKEKWDDNPIYVLPTQSHKTASKSG